MCSLQLASPGKPLISPLFKDAEKFISPFQHHFHAQDLNVPKLINAFLEVIYSQVPLLPPQETMGDMVMLSFISTH